MLCAFGCGSDCQYSYDLNRICQDWEAIYEITDEYRNDNILRHDSSRYCWLFSGTPFLRMFQDSTYITYDTVWRKGTKYLEPKGSGSFQLSKDSLMFDRLKLAISKISNDTLILQRKIIGHEITSVFRTTFINRHTNTQFKTFTFPSNIIDTVTSIKEMKAIRLDNGSPLMFTRYDRAYIYNQDTILHIVKDIPAFQKINKDSLLSDFNTEFRLYDLGDYGNQSEVNGHSYQTTHCVIGKYITYYNEEHCYNLVYMGACHGDCSHRYTTYTMDGRKVLFDDVFKEKSKEDVKWLIAEAVMEYRKKKGWFSDDYTQKNCYLGKLSLYARWDYTNRIALGKDGIIATIEYTDDESDLCFAENYIHAVVPYGKLKPYLNYPFNILTK